MNHIFEHEGIMLGMEYTRGADGIPDFGQIRALGEDYKPTGPDLLPMLAGMMVWRIPGVLLAPLMDNIVESLPS